MKPQLLKLFNFLKLYFHIGLFLIALLNGSFVHAQGDLLVYPKRVVFTDHQQFEQLNITNTGKDSTHYSISTINIKMGVNGGFQVMDSLEDGHQFADAYFRFFPREITLAPNESQTVKLQLIRKGELSNGEYRSHLYFRHDPQSKLGINRPKPASSEGMSIQITPTYGISIPIIIRKGEANAGASISSFSLIDKDLGTPKVTFELNRTGNHSVYGDLEITHTSKNHVTKVVGMVRGLAVYTPNTKRIVEIPLNLDSGTDLSTGILKISYKEGKKTYLMEAFKL